MSLVAKPVALGHYDAACQALKKAKSIDDVKAVRDAAAALRAYAKQAKNKDLEIDAAEIRIRAERRVGELMKAQRQTVGLATAGRPRKIGSEPDPISKPATLAEAGIDKHLADRGRKLAAMPDEKFAHVVERWRARTITDAAKKVNVDVLASTAHVSQNSGNNEWYTPEPYIKAARQVLGGVDLDPASSVVANKVVRAKSFFAMKDDGRALAWNGTVWMNPPYAQPLVAQFCHKLAASVQAKTVPAAVVLVNNATETAWFRELADIATAVCFPTGRVQFWSPEKESTAPLQGQAVLYIGPKVATFVAAFSHLGIVWVKP